MKVCAVCQEKKPVIEFHKHPTNRDGLDSRCRSCLQAYHQQRRASDPDFIRRRDLKRRYNLTIAGYDALLEEQEHRCAICGQQPEGKPLAVDHCHETKTVRGLLCRECNIALGLFQDNPDTLEKAITYLVKSKELQIDVGNAGEAGVVHGLVRS